MFTDPWVALDAAIGIANPKDIRPKVVRACLDIPYNGVSDLDPYRNNNLTVYFSKFSVSYKAGVLTTGGDIATFNEYIALFFMVTSVTVNLQYPVVLLRLEHVGSSLMNKG